MGFITWRKTAFSQPLFQYDSSIQPCRQYIVDEIQYEEDRKWTQISLYGFCMNRPNICNPNKTWTTPKIPGAKNNTLLLYGSIV